MAKKHHRVQHREHIETNPEIRALQDQIKKIKLQNELKIVQGTPEKKDEFYSLEERRARKELEDLKAKKNEFQKSIDSQKQGKGFLGKLAVGFKGRVNSANLNYNINQRRQYLNNEQALRNVTQKTKLTSAHVGLETERERLAALHKKNKLDLNSLGIGGESHANTIITENDLFKM